MGMGRDAVAFLVLFEPADGDLEAILGLLQVSNAERHELRDTPKGKCMFYGWSLIRW
jgi:hypothetical protein